MNWMIVLAVAVGFLIGMLIGNNSDDNNIRPA